MRSGRYTVTLDRAFAEVVAACAGPRRANPGGGTWITPEMDEAYRRLHDQGHAHSVETWRGEEMVGGLYGVALGGAFFGESMFSRASDASKVALAHLVHQLQQWGFRFVDCQLPTPHLESLGAESIRRRHYLALLESALRLPGRTGAWRFDTHLAVV